MNTKDIDLINVLLIIISLALAFNVPFGLFIFSYVLLGPLHYLTEINWLREKSYFVKNKQWIWILVGFGLLISLPFFFNAKEFTGEKPAGFIVDFSQFLQGYSDEILLVSLLFAVGLIHFKNRYHLLLFFVASTVIAIPLLYYLPMFAIAVLFFLPTVVHVYCFTLLFMLYGTMQSRNKAGVVAIVLLILAPVIIAMSHIEPSEYFTMRDYTKTSYIDSGFGAVNLKAVAFLGGTGEFNIFSQIAIKVQIFLAFAYTYHYLNWFSKTSVIGWNKNLSRSKSKTILFIWLASVALYLYNFKVGFIVLSSLSLMHVFLEFPLNVTSIKGILLKLKPSR
jgi:hypothetical protein